MRELDASSIAAAADRQGNLTKPAGSLGELERLGSQLAGIAACCPPPIPSKPLVVVAAGDHGVIAEGVTPWPQEVTGQMVDNFLAGGAAINVLAKVVGAEVVVADAGVNRPQPERDGLSILKVGRVTGNIRIEPAMSFDDAAELVDRGRRLAADRVLRGVDLFVTGDMGIGNTTPSAAIVAYVTGRSAQEVTGRGTGIGDEMLAHKVEVISDALARCGSGLDGLGIVSQLGGYEIAVLAGVMLGGADAGVPVIVDGVISLAAALVAYRIEPMVKGYLIAGHRSMEPGASAALEFLGLRPLLDLDLRLGEGSGGVLAVPLVKAAASILSEMATFDSAGVSEK